MERRSPWDMNTGQISKIEKDTIFDFIMLIIFPKLLCFVLFSILVSLDFQTDSYLIFWCQRRLIKSTTSPCTFICKHYHHLGFTLLDTWELPFEFSREGTVKALSWDHGRSLTHIADFLIVAMITLVLCNFGFHEFP